MNKFRFTLKAFAFLVFTLACASAAQAQATRTWVSGVGDDANPCSRTAPCKTFAGAISKTADKGEIDALDPGGYGTITITKNITIDGQGTMASILAAGTNGVVVNDSATASPNSIVVAIRNISINGAGSGFDGIRFLSGKQLNVEHCVISGFKGNGASSDGIDAAFTTSVSGNQRLFVKDTIVRDTTGDGIRASNTAVGGGVNAVIENVRVSQVGGTGLTAGTAARITAKDSSFNNNVVGVAGLAGNGGIDLDTCLMQGNTTGIAIAANTTRVANCRVTNNTNGVNFTGGAMVTYGDNKFDGNTNEAIGGSIPAPINKK